MKHKFLTALLAFVAALCFCLGPTACGDGTPEEEKGEDGHTHIAEQFQVDENGHWKTCTICGEKFAVGNHSYKSDNACKTCGYSAVYTKGLAYKLNEDTDTYTVTGLGEAAGTTDLIIPAYHEGKPVTAIGTEAFTGCGEVTSITIPDGVTIIGSSAFENCSGLASITIPDSVTLIMQQAFSNCGRLASITIPDSVTEIRYRAFEDCNRLAIITIFDNVTSIGRYVFSGTAYYNDASHWENGEVLYIGNHLIEAQETISGAYSIRQGTKTIADFAFYGDSDIGELLGGCPNLTSIDIPDGVISIGQEAFHGCSGLTSLNIPESVTKIGGFAFYNCRGLANIDIPDSVTSIGESAFAYTDYFNDRSHWENGEVLYIGKHFMYAKETISGAYSIRNGTKTIAGSAFHGCSGLTSIEIPDSVISIGDYAFCDCTGLTSIEIPDSVISIGDMAFDGCSALTSVTIGNGVTEIRYGAFSSCSGLTDIQFKGTVEEWQTIKKAYSWDYKISDYTVTCTDGTIAKSGK